MAPYYAPPPTHGHLARLQGAAGSDGSEAPAGPASKADAGAESTRQVRATQCTAGGALHASEGQTALVQGHAFEQSCEVLHAHRAA